MRQSTIQTTISVLYPEGIIWTGDETMVKISGPSGYRIGYQLKIENVISTENLILNYRSQFSHQVLVPISDAIKRLFLLDQQSSNTYSFTLTVFLNGVDKGSLVWECQVLNGKTLPWKQHGVNKDIYIYSPDELEGVEIYGRWNVEIWMNGQHEFGLLEGMNIIGLQYTILQPGDYVFKPIEGSMSDVSIVGTLPLSPTSQQIDLQYINSSEISSELQIPSIWLGDGFKGDEGWTIHYGRPCLPSGITDGSFLEIKYRDTDGCTRYVGGWLNLEELQTERISYTTAEPMLLFKKNLSHITSFSNTLTIGVPGIRRSSGVNELILSDDVEMRGDVTEGQWVPCKIMDEFEVGGNQEIMDIEIKIEF